MSTYNHAEYVLQAIESVLEQKNVEFEFLIADDGSADNTREVISAIQDDRIAFYPNTINRGACVVTNELIEKARSPYIALINSDDVWIDQNKLKKQFDFMELNPHVGACFGRAHFVDKNGNTILKSDTPYGPVFDKENRSAAAWLRYFFEYGNCICHPTMLIRKSCYVDVGFYNNRLRQLPDFDMWVRLVKKYDIHIFDEAMIQFRVIPEKNVSGQTVVNSRRSLNEHYLIALSFFDGVDANLLKNGFGDLLKNDDLRDEIILDIEKTLLMFSENPIYEKLYKLIALPKMALLLNSKRHADYLLVHYGIDDRWFQNEMGKYDLFFPDKMINPNTIKYKLAHFIKKLAVIPSLFKTGIALMGK